MKDVLFKELEQAIRDRNPLLAERLRRGKSKSAIRQGLRRAHVSGRVEPIVGLFSWKDGSDLAPSVPLEQASPFPGAGYYLFMPFSFILAHFAMFSESAKHHLNMKQVAGRYFPLFWNGSDSWLAVDLDTSNNSPVVGIHSQAEDPVIEAYSSFDDFITDALRANRENDSLSFFTSRKQWP